MALCPKNPQESERNKIQELRSQRPHRPRQESQSPGIGWQQRPSGERGHAGQQATACKVFNCPAPRPLPAPQGLRGLVGRNGTTSEKRRRATSVKPSCQPRAAGPPVLGLGRSLTAKDICVASPPRGAGETPRCHRTTGRLLRVCFCRHRREDTTSVKQEWEATGNSKGWQIKNTICQNKN